MNSASSGTQESQPVADGRPGRKSRRKGPRPVHQPQRTCIACRKKVDKRTLIRIVRTPDGQIEIDSTGKRNGRGAYVCANQACWTLAVSSGSLAHALKSTIDPDALSRLEHHARTLGSNDERNG